MKVGYQYVRISQAEQSNWSISGQQKINETYAQHHGIRIEKTFIDEGRSAKNFERPEWKRLVTDLAKNRHRVDYLIISKYDRLIRNTLEGLQQLQRLEEKWGVQVLSAMESYAINPQDPMFFKLRADLLVNAEFERRVISDRSKFGTWQAKLQGRHIGQAPWGYTNARDERNKPIIIMDKNKRDVICEIFDRYLAGDTLGSITESARQKGFNVKSNSAIMRVLQNAVYAGMIRVPSYKGSAEKLIDGLHEGMIDKHTFYAVNEKIRRAEYHTKMSINPNLPLRGLILCEGCGSPLTGSKSKGKGGYYFYYRCLRCGGQNHSAIKSHKQLIEILDMLSLSKEIIDLIHEQIVEAFKKRMSNVAGKISRLNREVRTLTDRLDSLEDKYIRDAISQDTFDKWSDRLRRDLNGKEHELRKLESLDESILFRSKARLDRMKGLGSFYQGMDVIRKQDMFKAIFPAVATKTKSGYRTPMVNPIFSHNLHLFKGLDLLEIEGGIENVASTPICTPKGSIIEHLSLVDSIFKVG